MSRSAREIDGLLAKPVHAVLGVNRPDGPPQLTVVWFAWDGESFVLSTLRTRAKVRLIQRNPAVTLLIDDPVERWYLVASGHAEIVEDHAALAVPLLEKYMPGRDSHETLDDPQRVIVRIHPDRIVTGS